MGQYLFEVTQLRPGCANHKCTKISLWERHFGPCPGRNGLFHSGHFDHHKPQHKAMRALLVENTRVKKYKRIVRIRAFWLNEYHAGLKPTLKKSQLSAIWENKCGVSSDPSKVYALSPYCAKIARDRNIWPNVHETHGDRGRGTKHLLS